MKKKEDNLVLILFCLFLLIGTIALMFRSEQVDTKKELSHKVNKGVIVLK